VKGQHADRRAEFVFSMGKSVVLTQITYSREYGLNERVARRTVYSQIYLISFKLMVQSSTDGKGRVVGDAVCEMTDTLNKWKLELIREGTPTSLRKMARVLGMYVPVGARCILRLDIKAKPYRLGLLHHFDASRLATPHSNRRRQLESYRF
jgi:hypothetical protein